MSPVNNLPFGISPLDDLPNFASIKPSEVANTIRTTVAEATEELAALGQADNPDAAWVEKIECIQQRIQRVWGPVAHLNSVVSSPALRDAYNECLPLVTGFQSTLGQNAALYAQFSKLGATLEATAETTLGSNPGSTLGSEKDALAALVRMNLRDFVLAGVALPGSGKAAFRKVILELASLQATFEQNLMDSTDAFSHHVADAGELAGLPAVVVDRARAAAAEKSRDGYLLGLDAPTFQAIMTHADSAALREHYYRSWVTRSSEHGPNPEQWGNSPVIERILQLRHDSAKLLGHENFASLSLVTKMADSVPQVLAFLEDLAERSRPAAEIELAELSAFAESALQPWDTAYYAEKLKQQRFSISDEVLRAYFPLPKVLSGLFKLAQELYSLNFVEVELDTLWHPTARYFQIVDADGIRVGGLLIDLFSRANKRGGAWMDACRDRARMESMHNDPVAYLVCNFSPPAGNEPSYLTHHDVQTLFHEFGHALHHLLTEIDYPSIAGINGVAWDAVELPSQFLENYAWLPAVLNGLSEHKETGEPIPTEMIETLIASRSFLGALAMMRQLEYALFDLRLHAEPEPPDRARVQGIVDEVRAAVSILPVPEFNRFQCSFAHIFGGGYAAGYYSYKWAEVLAADAFAAFKEGGAFDRETADRFRRSVLAVGGSRDAMQAFIDFRGRVPQLEPLLRQAGIA
jgi:oligopeptidase A